VLVIVLLTAAVAVFARVGRITGAAAVLLGSSVRVKVGVLLGPPPNRLPA
jgi:hypothetical protein